MDTYYIKYIWGPAGQKGYPENNNNVVTFAEGGEKQCERFKNCVSFLLYETGSRRSSKLKGAKSIYAWGTIDPNQENLDISPIKVEEKWFANGVRVIVKKRIDPKNGIPLEKIKELTGVQSIQRRGGLFKITEDQFNKFREMLETT